MKTFLENIKQTGLVNAISIAVVNGFYHTKSKYAVVSRQWNAEMKKKSQNYEDTLEDNHCSLGFAKALGFESAEECDEYFERWEREEQEEKKDQKQ